LEMVKFLYPPLMRPSEYALGKKAGKQFKIAKRFSKHI
jgi:hypothetical protein